MQGVYAPVHEQVESVELSVRGSLPPELTGWFMRNGSNPVKGNSEHWFLGDGMIHSVRLENGRATTYRNRWVDTPIYRAGGGLLSAEPPGGPVGQSNVSVVAHGGRFYSLGEIGWPYLIDAQTLGTTPTDFNGSLHTYFTAHPRPDPVTGWLHAFGYGLVAPYLTYHMVSPTGELTLSSEIDLGRPVMMHDFAITDSEAIFWDLPVIFDIDSVKDGALKAFKWRPDQGARIGVMPLGGPTTDIRWVEIEPCFVYHCSNAHREQDEVVIDVCWLPSAMAETFDDRPSRIERWRINTARPELTLTRETLSDMRMDLPSIDRRFSGRSNAYGWFANVVDDGPGGAVQLPGMTRLDIATGNTDSWLPGPWLAAGEGVFAPAGPGEGEGYIIGFVTDRRTMASSMVVVDAMNMKAGPVAWIDLPQRVPVGFHGAWMADT
jgi:carotenoid cleavage dioxygenase